MKAKTKVWLEKSGDLVFGSGKSELLKAIDETGSIKAASERMGISFRHGWGYVTAIEKRLGLKLIVRSKGGPGGGGSRLTPAARELVRKFDRMESLIIRFADKKFREVFADESGRCKNK